MLKTDRGREVLIMEITEIILNYADKHPVFTIKEITEALQIAKEQENGLRIALSRLVKADELCRYEKGIYGRMKKTAFINKKIAPSIEKMIAHVYLDNCKGYTSGGDYALEIGITTWCAAKPIIVSNAVNKTQNKENYIVRKPKTKITQDNLSYLQLLDCIEELKYIPVDNLQTPRIIYNEVKKRDIYKLLFYANNYYKKTVSNYIIQVIGENYDT